MLLGLLWLIPRVVRRARAGSICLAYLAAYSTGRLALEAIRIDYAHRILGLRINRWFFGTVLIAAGTLCALSLLPLLRDSKPALLERGGRP